MSTTDEPIEELAKPERTPLVYRTWATFTPQMRLKAIRKVTCPKCKARPGMACSTSDSGHDWTAYVEAAHFARYKLARDGGDQ